MAVNLSGIRRNFKNVAHNYTDAQVRVSGIKKGGMSEETLVRFFRNNFDILNFHRLKCEKQRLMIRGVRLQP